MIRSKKITGIHVVIILCLCAIVVAGALGYSRFRVLGESTTADRQIYGLILPHHDLASELIISSISRLSTLIPDPKYIVVISPNHWQPMSALFTTSASLSDTNVAKLQIDSLINQIPKVADDPDLIANEHGLTVPIRYLKAAYPDAMFLPIAISPQFSADEIQKLSRVLSGLFPSDTLFVASSDFSHGHMLTRAREFDTQTITAIAGSDYKSLYQFTDNNLDCPACVGLVLQIDQSNVPDRFELWQQSHGAIITGNPYNSGTSYISGVLWSPITQGKSVTP